MSKDVDRAQVFKTTKVRTSLKGDGSWIHKAKDEEEIPRTDSSPQQNRPVAVRQNSYVLSTAKKFGDSVNHANIEVIPTKADAQPEKSTTKTTEDTKPQIPTKDVIQKGLVEATYPTNRVEPVEQPVANTTVEDKEEYVNASVDQSEAEPSEGATKVSADAQDPVRHSMKETTELAVEVKVESTEKPEVASSIETEPEPANTSNADVGVESTIQPVKGNCEVLSSKEATVEAATDRAVEQTVPPSVEGTEESSVETTAVTNAAPGVESAVRDTTVVEPVPELFADSVSEVPPAPSADAAVKSVESKAESAAKAEPVETEAEDEVKSEVQSADEAVVEQSNKPTPDTATDHKMESNVEVAVEPVPIPVSEAPPEPAAVKSVECKAESAAKAEPVLETEAEGEVKREVQSADDVEQSSKPTPDTATDHKMESNVDVAVEPVPESVGEAVQDQLPERAIELVEALDVDASRALSVPEHAKEPHSEEMRLNQESASTNTGSATEIFQKPELDLPTIHILSETRDDNTICSYCDKIIEGNVKIMLNYPPVSSHPECLKCGVCGSALGDMLTAMFLHDHVLHCRSCFEKTL